MCVLKRWPCTQISGHKGEILRSWYMQERCHQPSSAFFTSQLLQHFKSPVIFVLIVCLCNFLQIREFSFKFAHCCCNLSERHKKRVTENQLASIWAICAVFRNGHRRGQRLKEMKEGNKDEVLLLCKAVAHVHWPHCWVNVYPECVSLFCVHSDPDLAFREQKHI